MWSSGGEDAVKMAAHRVFLLINPEGGVRAWGLGAKEKQKPGESSAIHSDSAYVLSVAFISLCGAHIYAKLIAQEVEWTISMKSLTASTHCLRGGGKWKPDV